MESTVTGSLMKNEEGDETDILNILNNIEDEDITFDRNNGDK